MNLSTFFFDKLSRTDSNLALNGKKSIDANYIFSDLIKVFEGDNTSSNEINSFSQENTQELFSNEEKIVNLSPQEFRTLDNLIHQILNDDQKIEVSKTDYKFTDAEITKEKFVVDKDKLIEFLSTFFQNQKFKLSDAVKTRIENDGKLSITFKNKLNKISVTITPIITDPQIEQEVNTDDFLFVNKLLVDSLSLQSKNGQSLEDGITSCQEDNEKNVQQLDQEIYLTKNETISNQSTKDSSLNELSIVVGNILDNNFIHEKIAEKPTGILDNSNNPVSVQSKNKEQIQNAFYKVELIKISDLQRQDTSTNMVDEFSLLQNKVNSNPDSKIVSTHFENDLKANSDNEEFKPEEIVYPKIKSEQSQNIPNSNEQLSLKDIYNELTDEEKSVFKKYEESNEIKKVVYTINKIEKNETEEINSKPVNYDYAEEEILNKNNVGSNQDFNPESNSKLNYGPNITQKDIKEVNLSNEKSISKPNQKEIEVEEIIELKKVLTEPEPKTNHVHQNSKEKNSIILSDESNSEEEIKSKNIKPEENIVVRNNVLKIDDEANVERKQIFNKPIIFYDENGKLNEDKIDEKDIIKIQTDVKPSIQENVLVKVSSSPNLKIFNDLEKENIAGKLKISDEKNSEVIVKENNSIFRMDDKQTEKSTLDKKVEIKQTESKNHLTDENQYQTSDKNSSENRNNFEANKNIFTKSDIQHINLAGSLEFDKIKTIIDQRQYFESTKVLQQHEIIPEFSKFIQLGEKQTISFQLTPENLGKVNLIVDLVDNVVTTKIEVENEQIKQFIQSNLDQLKNNLQSNGIQLNNINISLADYSQKQNGKVVTEKKKYNSKVSHEEEKIEEVRLHKATKKMGYNTYEFLA